ncbi:tryptophan synthase subunit alpha [Streptomyces californicus]|uniref:tryptophan synthase subunit alpha n=1 Tax=Streptomyces californicus TaxID=67351 RepID=UPI00296EC5EE|nr:tryptophan synthase subunit alpha [Streptomyces californicus]MDW4916337.1 tryptophan synthase subunit alpha [Streptomyces californicus]
MSVINSAAVRLTARLTPASGTLGVFLPAGFPGPGLDTEAFTACAEAGAGILEVGVPTAAPTLDGPDITKAYQQALEHGTGVTEALNTVTRVAAATTASVVVMSYWDPVSRYGLRSFARDLAAAGAAGAMIPDLPPDKARLWHTAAQAKGLCTPQFTPRPSTEAELVRYCAAASGWIYVPAALGPTGSTAGVDHDGLQRFVGRCRRTSDVPLVTGIGVSTPEIASAVNPYVDGVVVGSPIVRALLARPDRTGITAAADRVALFAEALRPTGAT